MQANQSQVTHNQQSLSRSRTEEKQQFRLAIMSTDALLAGIPEKVVNQMYLGDNYADIIFKAANSGHVAISKTTTLGRGHLRKNAVVWEDIIDRVSVVEVLSWWKDCRYSYKDTQAGLGTYSPLWQNRLV